MISRFWLGPTLNNLIKIFISKAKKLYPITDQDKNFLSGNRILSKQTLLYRIRKEKELIFPNIFMRKLVELIVEDKVQAFVTPATVHIVGY